MNNNLSSSLKKVKFMMGSDFRKLPIMGLLFIFVAMMDFLGLGFLFAILTALVNPVADSLLQKYISFIELSLTNVFIAFFVIFAFKTFLSIYVHNVILSFSLGVTSRIRSQIIKQYLKIDFMEHVRRNSSHTKYLITDLAAVFGNKIIKSFLVIFSETVLLVTIFCFVFLAIGISAPFLFLLVFLIFFFLYKATKFRLRDLGRQLNIYNKELIKKVAENIDGFKEIKVLSIEETFIKKIELISEKLRILGKRVLMIKMFPKFLLELIIVILIGFYLLLLSQTGTSNEELIMTVATLGLAILRMIPSSNKIFSSFQELSNQRNAISLLYKDLVLINNLKIQSKRKRDNENFQSVQFKSLEFRKVSFSYKESLQLLTDVSFKISANDFVGIIGKSGSGKTSLVNLILGLTSPHSGDILINEKHGYLSQKSILNCFSYLPQDPLILDSSILENITFETDMSLVNEKLLEKVLKMTNLKKFVNQLPNKIDTFAGERGVRISGGQKQRIALARSLYFNKSFIILDEPTSSLDKETEEHVSEEIRRLLVDKTVLMVTHNVEILKNCNKILKMVNGGIIQFNSYKELINSSQFNKENNE